MYVLMLSSISKEVAKTPQSIEREIVKTQGSATIITQPRIIRCSLPTTGFSIIMQRQDVDNIMAACKRRAIFTLHQSSRQHLQVCLRITRLLRWPDVRTAEVWLGGNKFTGVHPDICLQRVVLLQ